MTAYANRGIFRKFQTDAHNKHSGDVIARRSYYDMDAPYQRGHVWGVARQRKLIESLLMGIPVAAIVVNERPDVGDRVFVVDGKQRLTAILDFVDGKYTIPAEWIGDLAEGRTGMLTFPELSDVGQRIIGNLPIAFVQTVLRTVEEESELFDRLNFGGVPQGSSDFDD